MVWSALPLMAKEFALGATDVARQFVNAVKAWAAGLNASGGPEGVGRAVNRAVVACLVSIFFVNLIFTQWVLAAFPQTGVFH